MMTLYKHVTKARIQEYSPEIKLVSEYFILSRQSISIEESQLKLF